MGLRGRMAASYVMVTAAAVLAVEAVLLGVYVPSLVSGTDLQARLQDQANRDAKVLSLTITKLRVDYPEVPAARLLFMAMKASNEDTSLGGTPRDYKKGVEIVPTDGMVADRPVEVLVDGAGQVLGSSAQGTYSPGSAVRVPPGGGGGKGLTPAGEAVWWASPVLIPASIPPSPPSVETNGSIKGTSLVTAGYVYVQAPPGYGGDFSFSSVYPMVLPGALALSLVLPVGLLFGLLSTRRLIGRVRRLAAVTGAVSRGDFRPRVPVTPGDEVGLLEEAFNLMTERLRGAVAAERLAAEADARHAERARIAGELHDSISQDLFSLSLLAAGMRRAAPEALRPQAEAMERTAARAMREMQALLLELRPVALEDAGLVPALDELCRAYEARLGIRVTSSLEEVSLPPAAEHAVLRLVQESLGNAIKHAEPESVDVRLRVRDGGVLVEVGDDGAGFDPASAASRHGMGLRLMSERVRQLGGVLELTSEPGRGTTVSARLPLPASGRPPAATAPPPVAALPERLSDDGREMP
ncbi:hypothetical protein GCM10009530_12250 [Microbispora corallina]|uniref:Oxygen sensor histidine kinase NreB n=1 Tax=Microbispora corallina TaxID=83302 RepID=A0ABQ4FTE7_9ACTN|nr:HAMP domain-containing sensor histidine kinase [Microbispora corallina]GIH38078.1 hypothetical protein Mco01_10780 [Microbispora corallina]